MNEVKEMLDKLGDLKFQLDVLHDQLRAIEPMGENEADVLEEADYEFDNAYEAVSNVESILEGWA